MFYNMIFNSYFRPSRTVKKKIVSMADVFSDKISINGFSPIGISLSKAFCFDLPGVNKLLFKLNRIIVFINLKSFFGFRFFFAKN